jgi:putative phosphoesterase
LIIGILADTHGRIEPAKTAIGILRDQGAQFYIHCGDVGSESVLDLLAGLPAAFVFGNNDWDRAAFERYAKEIGIQCLGSHGELDLDGKKFVITHGDDSRFMHRIIDQQQHDYLLFGHTHIPADRHESRLRLINPGALHRTRQKTVATLDTLTDELKFHNVIG